MSLSSEFISRRPDRWTVTIFVLIAAVKTLAIAVDGPGYTQDSYSYVAFADQIVADDSWIDGSDLGAQGRSSSTLRMIGYPALIVSARSLAGEHFDYVLIVLQCVVSLLANIVVYWLCLALTRSWMLSLLGALLYAKTIVFQYDLYVLTDSLFGSLFTIVLAKLALAALRRRLPSTWGVLGLGVLVAGSVLLREVGVYWGFFQLAMLLVATRTVRQPLTRTFRLLLLFALPTLVVVSTYLTWNHSRTGSAFLTAGTATALMVPFLEVDAERFDGDSPLDKVSRDKLQQRNFDEVLEIMDTLHQDYGLSVVDMAPIVRNRYMRSVLEHPTTYFLHALKSFAWFAPQMLFETPRAIYLIAGRKGHDFRTRMRVLQSSGGVLDWLQLGLEVLFAALSTFLFGLFLLGPPLQLLRTKLGREPIPRELNVMLVLWLTYMGCSWMYHYVHFETRYITGVLFCALVIAVRMLQDLPAGRFFQK